MFGRLFDLNSPFWQAAGKIADIVWLNILMLVCSLPVVTIGASLTAVYDTARRILSETGGGTTAMFWKSFTANLRQATLLWLVVGPAGLALVALWVFVRIDELLVVKVFLSAAYLLVFPFVWALQARFENPVGRTLKNAAVVAFAGLPLALAILLVDGALIALTVVVALRLPQAVVLLAMLGYPLLAFANTPLLERALRPLLERATGVRPDAG